MVWGEDGIREGREISGEDFRNIISLRKELGPDSDTLAMIIITSSTPTSFLDDLCHENTIC